MVHSGGPIATTHIEQFTQFLISEGYAPPTISAKRALARELSMWMKHRGLSLCGLDESKLEQFHAYRLRRMRHYGQRSSAQLLQFLRSVGAIRYPRPTVNNSPIAILVLDYESFLNSERGLSRASVARYLPTVQRFLDEHLSDNARCLRDGLQDLTPKDMHRFVLREARRVNTTHAKFAVTALRSFMRFLKHRGWIRSDLASTLSGVAHWRLSHIPKSLSSKDVGLVLQSCDRATSSGQRDYAVLLLLARLGLRGGEVLALTLDDLDWRQGEILVRGKGQRFERLPLPQDVGAALVYYLRYVRPKCTARKVFIRSKAPWQPLSQSAICGIVSRALKRCGLSLVFKGAHLFRHSLATDMIRRGASLREIGQILRHSHDSTTQIYAKVDIQGLRDIGLSWMGGTQ